MADNNTGATGTGSTSNNDDINTIKKERDDLKSTNAGLDRKIAELLTANKTLELGIAELKTAAETDGKTKLSEMDQLKKQLLSLQDQLDKSAHETAREKRAKYILEKYQEHKLDDPDYRDLLMGSTIPLEEIETRIKTRAEAIQKAIDQKANDLVAQRVNGPYPKKGDGAAVDDFSKLNDTELHKLGIARPEFLPKISQEISRRAQTLNTRRN